ncbi:MAG TPA: tRNA preQ1(34) S-adenosylmethionine ribosyltransferase-isomerase QueA [Candidatus Polarisedimenticolaceae bacterium]|nr:tRNA preQ1(34) S-adenosylmethionine ribosyltransferase-isomerase QueA [Candidatus Polarisedimenticolaceae bacterium]
MRVDEFDYRLPPDRIAQRPAARRDGSRLLVLDRRTGELSHSRFDRLADWLTAGDLLVLNDTRVFPARLHGRKPTGGRVELLLTERCDDGRPAPVEHWRCLIGGAVRAGERLTIGPAFTATVIERGAELCRVRLESSSSATVGRRIDEHGVMPLPPYVKRPDPASLAGEALSAEDRSRYQTLFARHRGAVAAPTAGLHFSERTFAALDAAGVERAFLTLHVGAGTFAPVRVARVEDHVMHDEWFELGRETVDRLERTREHGGRVVAVGTTVVRALEHAAGDGRPRPARGRCDLFIYPGYRFRVVDALLTNFHLPRSTLLMLVSAFAGREHVLAAYDVAVGHGYRFYSYGDAMLIRSPR